MPPSDPHRLFHTLVVASALVLEGSGCGYLSHTAESDSGVDPTVPEDSGSPRVDAADPISDAAMPETDAFTARMCEPGWSPTKATQCIPLAPGTQECCKTFDEPTDCCVWLLPEDGEG